MHSIAETQTELKALLAKGLDQALKRLETALDPASPSFNTFVQIKARYSAYLSTVILGMVSQAELDHTYAQLCHAFLLTVDGLSASDLKAAEAPGAAEGPRRGELLYHIPRQMQEQREYRCAVRVAYLRALLREDWAEHRDDAEKSIRVAEVMAVELLNHGEEKPFSIHTPNDTIQFLDPDDFTEWLFYVKPRRVGAFSLDLRVSVIEVRNGREVKKDVVLEQHVVVATEAPEPAAAPVFDRSGVALDFDGPATGTPADEAPKGNPLGSNRALRATALFLAFLMFGTTATWALMPPVTREWWLTTLRDTPQAYDRYIKTFEKTDRRHLEEAYFQKAVKTDSLSDWRAYQQAYPAGEHQQAVAKVVETLEYRAVQNLQVRPVVAAFTQYVRDFPDGARFAEVAQLAETAQTDVPKETLRPLMAKTSLEALQARPTPAAASNLLQQYPEQAARPELRRTLDAQPALKQQVLPLLDSTLMRGLRRAPDLDLARAVLDEFPQRGPLVAKLVAKQPALQQSLAPDLKRAAQRVQATEAQSSIEAAPDEAAWQSALAANTVEAYNNFIKLYPQSSHRAAAREHLAAKETKNRLAAENAERLRKEEVARLAAEAETARKAKKAERQRLAQAAETKRKADDAAAKKTTEPAQTLPSADAVATVADLARSMVRVKGGTFIMGSLEGDKDAHPNEKPAHAVTLSDFSIGKYEVTQAQWRAVVDSNSFYYKGCDSCPVEQVSWDEAQDFIKKLNALDPGKNYRLPTEAEWEYAAKGGAAGIANGGGTKYAGSDNIAEVAWYGRNSESLSHPVGGKKANALGLYDMSGNVYEWCSDWYGDYKDSGMPVLNPKGADQGSYRVFRGCGWSDDVQYCRVSIRSSTSPTPGAYALGFRLVLQ